MENLKIFFSDDLRDFSGWMHEKSGRHLVSLCEVLQEKQDLVDSQNFVDALDEALEIYALINGNLNGIHSSLVLELLIKYNLDGYDFLYDLIHDTHNGVLMKKVLCCEKIPSILSLIKENNRTNSSRIAEMLAVIEVKNTWTERLANDLEYVHQGNKTWNWFYDKYSNNSNPFIMDSDEKFIMEVYDYFHSDEYKNAEKYYVVME